MLCHIILLYHIRFLNVLLKFKPFFLAKRHFFKKTKLTLSQIYAHCVLQVFRNYSALFSRQNACRFEYLTNLFSNLATLLSLNAPCLSAGRYSRRDCKISKEHQTQTQDVREFVYTGGGR